MCLEGVPFGGAEVRVANVVWGLFSFLAAVVTACSLSSRECVGVPYLVRAYVSETGCR